VGAEGIASFAKLSRIAMSGFALRRNDLAAKANLKSNLARTFPLMLVAV
jgi:hypothetical protein